LSIFRTILFKCLVKQFYRQHAGLLAFLFFMLVLVVGRANEAGLLEYHFALITGILNDRLFFMLVLLVWLFWAIKCCQFITRILRKPEFSFLSALSLTRTWRAYRLLLEVEILVFLPVILYALIIAAIGFNHHQQELVIWMLLFILAVCSLSARWFLYLLQNPGSHLFEMRKKAPSLFWSRFFWSFPFRYALGRRRLVFLIIKLYSCGMFYLLIIKQTPSGDDLSMIFLFYSFGLLGHGILIRQIREMEEAELGFYRSLQISLLKRYLQYGCLYFLLFIPEIIMIACLTPGYLRYQDAGLFIIFGYSTLLLMNSLLFVRHFPVTTFLKIAVVYFFIIFAAVLSGTVLWLAIISLLLSVIFFFKGYYAYE
jgi:hypothetical protein